MTLAINDTARISKLRPRRQDQIHDWIDNSWWCCFRTKGLHAVCTTELGYMARIKPEFDKRGVKIIGLSVDQSTNTPAGRRHQRDAGFRAQLSDDRRRRLKCLEALRHVAASVSAIPPSAPRPTTRRCATFSSSDRTRRSSSS